MFTGTGKLLMKVTKGCYITSREFAGTGYRIERRVEKGTPVKWFALNCTTRESVAEGATLAEVAGKL